MKKRPALARSISTLIGPNDDVLADLTRREGALIQVSVESLVPNPYQPRATLDEESLAELTESVSRHGILQPVLVRPSRQQAGKYELIAGHRRLEAAKRVALATLPAVVHDADDNTLLELALIENLQREDLNPVDEALAYQQLIDRLHYRHEDIAERVGKSRSHVTNMLRLLLAPPPILAALRENQIQTGHARALLALQDTGRILAAFEQVRRGALSVRATEALVHRLQEEPVHQAKAAQAHEVNDDPNVAQLETLLQHALGTRVQIKHSGKNKGYIRIDFYTLDDIDRILQRLGIPPV